MQLHLPPRLSCNPSVCITLFAICSAAPQNKWDTLQGRTCVETPDYIESDAPSSRDVVLAEHDEATYSHQVQAVHAEHAASVPAEHVRIMSKYDTPNHWIATVFESVHD
jgi:hypothetical protein